MSNRISEIMDRINQLESELEKEVAKRHALMEEKFLAFGEEIKNIHQKAKVGAVRYLFNANLLFILSAPIIYSLIIAFVLLDIMVSFYQAICFPIYKIEKVKRKNYMTFDRHKLSYLNMIEKMNCLYCSYGNGVIAYAREVAAQTEKYWCPIKHSLRIHGVHKYYRSFEDYGDGDEYQEKLLEHQDELKGGDKKAD
ncbi:MAG: hypothetical protein L3J15_03590 [Devosiaceae bacterium]|nr:hypothetical protein [Devosiaceae bacterium]